MPTVPLVAPPGLDVRREPRVVVPCDQPVAQRADRLRQRVIGGLEAHPHRVAPDCGCLAHVEDRSERRSLQERDVGMPPRSPVFAPVDGQDFGTPLQRRDHGVRRGHLAELPGEVGLHLGSEILVGEEQHQVPAQRATHLGDDVVTQRTTEIEAPHLRPDVGRDRPDVQSCHQSHAVHRAPPCRWPQAAVQAPDGSPGP